MPAACDLGTDQVLNAVADRDIRLTVDRDEVLRITFRDRRTHQLFDWTGWTFASTAEDGIGNNWATAIVTHNGTGGQVVVVYPKAETATLTAGEEGVWDLVGTDPDLFDHQVMEGAVFVRAGVT